MILSKVIYMDSIIGDSHATCGPFSPLTHHISQSSYCAEHARISSKSWIQIDLGEILIVTGVAILVSTHMVLVAVCGKYCWDLCWVYVKLCLSLLAD